MLHNYMKNLNYNKWVINGHVIWSGILIFGLYPLLAITIWLHHCQALVFSFFGLFVCWFVVSLKYKYMWNVYGWYLIRHCCSIRKIYFFWSFCAENKERFGRWNRAKNIDDTDHVSQLALTDSSKKCTLHALAMSIVNTPTAKKK